ncbi:mast cell protease 1A-like [Euwallacea fornicatus]|uniref:mast cell protease 1A-like n=1 Tax=Euwallacea fornicatus TaxID=995702 RepID=UPI00338D5449
MHRTLFLVLGSYLILREGSSAPAAVRIVNGTVAKDGEFPYIVELRKENNTFLCGGSIIGKKWVLTAGHCVQSGIVKNVVYGTNTLYNEEEVDTYVNISKVHLHPKFKYNFTKVGAVPLYDVGIVELEKPLQFSDKVSPITLTDSYFVPYHVDGTLCGWGSNSTTGFLQRKLQKVTLQLLTGQECIDQITEYSGEEFFNPVHNLCSDDHWKGECFGDSGSPYVIDDVQHGIVSWSVKPCGSNPGTYTRIGNPDYRDFIKNVTGI